MRSKLKVNTYKLLLLYAAKLSLGLYEKGEIKSE